MQIWNIEGGLPSNSVYALRQTQDGFLWIGTQDGLVRFDGINFKSYTRGTVPQLKSNVIRALYEDGSGTLWIGTSDGGLTRYKEGEFTTYPITKYRSLNKISAIEEDRWDNLWIGSTTAGLTCFRSGKFTTYTAKQGLPHNRVNFIYKDEKRDLWVTTAAGIVKISKPGLFQVYASQDLLPYFNTACLYEGEGNIWIGTGGKGLFRLKNNTLTAYGPEAGVPVLTINYLYKDRMESLWIGTDGGGLIRMRKDAPGALPGKDRLPCGFVYSIYEDREGSLWIGTLDEGLHQLRDSKFITYTAREGLAHDYIYCIHAGRAGDILIGTKQGLNRLKNGKLTTVSITKEGLLHNPVLCLCEGLSGCLRIGTLEGLHTFEDGKLTTLTKKHGLSDNRVRCILEDSRGNTWIGTENGLNRSGNNSGKYTIFTTKQGLSSNFIRFIFEDSRGRLWIGTEAGLNCLRHGVINAYNLVDGTGNNHARCVYEDNEGVLWFGTGSGLIRVTIKEKETARYTYNVQCGLVENYIYSILEDERGYLWLAGRKGISRIRKKDLEDFSAGKIQRLEPDSYDEKDGMKSGWCTAVGCKTRDGKLWFPTARGVAVIDSNHIKTDTLPPSIIMEKFVVDGESVNIKSYCGGEAVFSKRAPLIGSPRRGPAGGILELAPGKKRLEFYYTSVSFINPQKIKFKVKLVGYDNDWVDMGTLRSATYTGLDPGHYTFNVTTCNPDGVWNEKGVSFSFKLKPYFYQTTWFYFLAVLLVLLVGFTLYRFRVRQLRAREKELSTQVELRTRDLKERNIELEDAQQKIRHSKELIEAKNLQLEDQSEKLKELDKAKSRFFANISHEFRTPLTLIMGPLEQRLANCRDKQQEWELKMMLRNSQRLLNLINQLLELSKIESGTVKLRVSRQNIISFLKGIRSAFEILADKNEVDLTFYAEKEDIPLYFDPERIEEVICNLLINALKFTPAGGRINVAVREFPAGSLEISVSDTGPGIPREQITSIFDRFYQMDTSSEQQKKGFGIGLALVKEFITLHHGEIQVNSVKGKGTEFVIRLPLGKEHLEPGAIADLTGTTPPSGCQPGISGRLVSMLDLEGEQLGPAFHEDNGGETRVDEQPGRDIVLVVEDSVDMRQYIKNALEPQYNVEEAVDGREGIQKAQEIIPDLIISDIMMPGIDGYELCRVLKADRNTSHVPVILLTAKAAEESIIRGLETGADDYITKPFNTKILLARIKNLIDLRRHLQQTIDREMTLQPTEIAVSTVDKEFMEELKTVIETNISDPDFNVEGLSKKLYMSHATVYRKIHALTGESPQDFIRSYRLKRGAELLKSSYGNVGDVAFEVGFSSTSYFIKCFKEKFQQLPSSYMVSD